MLAKRTYQLQSIMITMMLISLGLVKLKNVLLPSASISKCVYLSLYVYFKMCVEKCVWRREKPPQNFKLHTQFLFFKKVIKDVCCIIIASWKKNSSNLLKAPKIITTIILITSKLTTTVSV